MARSSVLMSSVAKQVSSNTNKILGALHLYYNNKLETGHQVGVKAFLITVTAMSLNLATMNCSKTMFYSIRPKPLSLSCSCNNLKSIIIGVFSMSS